MSETSDKEIFKPYLKESRDYNQGVKTLVNKQDVNEIDTRTTKNTIVESVTPMMNAVAYICLNQNPITG